MPVSGTAREASLKSLAGREFSAQEKEAAPAAFSALRRGDATEGQQRLVLKLILKLADPLAVAPHGSSEREVGMIDGARWLGREIGNLTGAGVPLNETEI